MLSILTIWLSFAANTLAGTSYFKLELTWGRGAPDGHERGMIFINGQYPGPLLEIQQGDWVEIEVWNRMPFNSTIHAHGIHQINTPWSDGVPGLTQKPIQPDGVFKYGWHADTYGSYFYHAHSRGQIDDGAYGPIVIRPRAGILKPFNFIPGADFDELEEAESNSQPLLLTDWRHRTSDETWNDQMASGIESAVCMDSLLVNGRGVVECLSREDIDAAVDPGILPLLTQNGLKLTNKGCLPPEFYQITLGNTTAVNTSTIPPEVFKICRPSYGSREVIRVPQDKKWLALDVISTAGIDTFAFSIDEHPMWVFAVDAHYIEPLKVDVLHVANGDRYSVFIQLDKEGSRYGIRVVSIAATQVIATTAVLSYYDEYTYLFPQSSADVVASTSSINLAGDPISENITTFNQADMKSFPPQFPQPAPEPEQTFFLNMSTVGNSITWALNTTPLSHPMLDDMTPPLLWQDPNASRTGSNVTITTRNNTWIDLVFISHQLLAPPHPIHKHSNRAFIIGQGEGTFEWKSIAEAAAANPDNFNLWTPPYRDGFVVPPTSFQPTWLAVRYHVVNPGAWMLHCHIQSHLNGGMAMVILDGVDAWPEVPDDCKN